MLVPWILWVLKGRYPVLKLVGKLAKLEQGEKCLGWRLNPDFTKTIPVILEELPHAHTLTQADGNPFIF